MIIYSAKLLAKTSRKFSNFAFSLQLNCLSSSIVRRRFENFQTLKLLARPLSTGSNPKLKDEETDEPKKNFTSDEPMGETEKNSNEEADFVKVSKAKFSNNKSPETDDFRTKLSDWTVRFKAGLREAAYDLVGMRAKEKSTIVRKLRPLDPKEKLKDDEKHSKDRVVLPGQVIAPEVSGAMAIVKSATEVWEILNARLKESQLIQDILAGGQAVSKRIGVDEVAKKAKNKISDKMEDAAEAWETSQHPLVYRASSVWDRITAETDAAAAQRLLRRLDPYFDIEIWKADLARDVIPEVIGGWLRGDPDTMRNWLNGDVLKKYLAEIEARKKADRIMDPHVLDIRHVDVLTYRMDGEYAQNPALVVVFMLQHIDCVRNSKGEVVSGTDAHASARHFLISMHRRFDEEKQELRWRVGDIQDIGSSIPFY